MNDKSTTFKCKAHAKWILSGEHAVLRDSPAIVFPLLDKTITLSYTNNDQALKVNFDSPYGETLLLLFWGLFDTALEKLGQVRTTIFGQFNITNSIPMGAGMGFSAALCVVITRWLIWYGVLEDSQLFSFARDLENHVHGESSGVDIAGSIHEQGLLFDKSGHFEIIQPQWQPYLTLSYNEPLSVTAHCIQSVSDLWKHDSKQAQTIDQRMKEGTLAAFEALRSSSEHACQALANALQQAYQCFKAWHLIPHETSKHIEQLLQLGALACKPTGAGNGGYIISLWPTSSEPLPQQFSLETVRCY